MGNEGFTFDTALTIAYAMGTADNQASAMKVVTDNAVNVMANQFAAAGEYGSTGKTTNSTVNTAIRASVLHVWPTKNC